MKSCSVKVTLINAVVVIFSFLELDFILLSGLYLKKWTKNEIRKLFKGIMY